MRILGIDPGYAIMGWGIVDMQGNHFTPLAYDSITTSKDMEPVDRLKCIYNELMGIIAEYAPESASIEQLFFNTNATTGIMVAEARGVAMLACANSGVQVYEYTPLQIKQALTGHGRAEKKQMQEMVRMFLNLEKVPKPDDTADALAAAICHGHSGTYLDRMKKIRKGI
ncbi:MAG: crossover junction endodeoxyribonuclease RuvC [Firmicutes bacterium]|nr:crossover junction endodeoxyribonuclease RuvC [Bacillota bacterium]